MAHIHEKIDLTVAILVVHDGKVLVVHHRKLGKWLPLGGHVELGELRDHVPVPDGGEVRPEDDLGAPGPAQERVQRGWPMLGWVRARAQEDVGELERHVDGFGLPRVAGV